MGTPEKATVFRNQTSETPNWKFKSLPAPQNTSKAIYWLAEDPAQMAHNTTFSHYLVISTTKSHSLILWAHQLTEQHEQIILVIRLEQKNWEESLKEQQGRTQDTTTAAASPESRKTGMGSEITGQVLVMSQELCASHGRKGAQHPAGEQHHSLVKGHNHFFSVWRPETGGLSSRYLRNRLQKEKQEENPRSVYNGEWTVAETIKRQRELKQKW